MVAISLIVPVFNVEKYLRDCINSILEQTFTNFELLLINDGSSDKSAEICDEYAQRDQRVRVIHKKNEGPSSARNLGIKLSRGKYLGFVDSDDTIGKRMYEKMYNTAVENNAQIVACGYIEVNTAQNPTKWVTPLGSKHSLENEEIKNKLENLLSQNKVLGYACMWNKLYNRDFIFKENLLINEKISIAEDLCFNLVALSKANKICAISEPLYIYRRINTKSLMNDNKGKFYTHLKARKAILDTIKSLNINPEVYLNFLKYENSKTVGAYLNLAQSIINSERSLFNKYSDIKKIINEDYFIEAIKNIDNKLLDYKAKLILFFIKVLLIFKRPVE